VALGLAASASVPIICGLFSSFLVVLVVASLAAAAAVILRHDHARNDACERRVAGLAERKFLDALVEEGGYVVDPRLRVVDHVVAGRRVDFHQPDMKRLVHQEVAPENLKGVTRLLVCLPQ
jgi:hypothetical protein